MNNLIKAELTTYGVDPARFGLLGAVVAAHDLTATCQTQLGSSTWTGVLANQQIDDLLDALVKLADIPFELQLDSQGDFSVNVFTPGSGLSSANTDSMGNVVITEHRLRELFRLSNQSMPKFQRLLSREMLEPLFNEFEESLEQVEAPKRKAVVA